MGRRVSGSKQVSGHSRVGGRDRICECGPGSGGRLGSVGHVIGLGSGRKGSESRGVC